MAQALAAGGVDLQQQPAALVQDRRWPAL